MKTKLIKILALMLMTILLASSIACGGNKNGDNGDGGTSEAPGEVNAMSIEGIQAKYDANLYQYYGEPVTLTMSHWDSDGANIERAVLETLLKAFKNRYPTIDVKLDIISDYENVYSTNIASNNMHDVFMVSDGVFANWSTGGKMVNLDPYITQSDLVNTSDMYESVVTRYQYNSATGLTGSGNQLVMPRDISAHVMYYNKDYFEQKGVAEPPKDRIMSIDEAVTMWKALTEYDGDEVSVYGVAGIEMEGLVWSAGGDFLTAERNGFPTDAATVNAIKRAYQFIQDAYHTYKITPPASFSVGMDPTTMFSMERVATVLSGSWEVASFRSLGFDWDIAYVPAFEVNPEANSWSGSCGYAMSTTCANKEAAWKLIEYIGSPEGQEILSATGFQFPLYKSIGYSEEYLERESALKPANYRVFIDSAAKQPAGTWTYTKSSQWKELSYDMYSEYLLDDNASNRWTVDEFISKVKSKVNELLA